MTFIPIEKKALISMSSVFILFFFSFIIIGKKNLWFEKKAYYFTLVSDAEGLREGTQVTLNGLRIGAVTELKVNEDNKIKVFFSVTDSVKNKIRQDSVARVMRAMLIGDKKIDLIPGTKNAKIVAENGFVQGVDSHEIADLLSGRNLSLLTDKMKGFSEGVTKLSDTMNLVLQKIRPKDIARTYDLMVPILNNVFAISKDLKSVMKSAKVDLFDNKLTYHTLNHFNQTLTPFAKRDKLLDQILDNMGVLSKELAANPEFAKQILGSLQEMIITLKAIQKTWFLKSHIKDLKKK